jgi:hypothetical protein
MPQGRAVLFTKLGDTPAFAGVLHQDGSISEVRVETNENDDFVVTFHKSESTFMQIREEAF